MMYSSNIEDTATKDVNFPPVYERYFSHYYFMPKNANKKTMIKSYDDYQKQWPSKNSSLETSEDLETLLNNSYHPNGQDTLIMMHSNRICVVCISEKHPIIAENKKIKEVCYDVGGGLNRLLNKVSGKGKRGAQVLGLFSPLCKITCEDNSSYILFSGVRGKLVEVNERLVDQPNLITEAPKSNGYLAIILPKLNESNNLKDILLSPSEYQKIYEREEGSGCDSICTNGK